MGRNPDISKALLIDGWMNEPALLWLGRQAQIHQRIVELGSYKGRSTRALADNTDGVIFAIDTWNGPWEVDLETSTRQAIYPIFTQNMAGVEQKVKVIKCDHAIAPTGLKPDMVFIDGDHFYEVVKRDIVFGLSQLSGGGLLCGHDWQHAPVRFALDELIPGYQADKEADIWFYYQP